MRKKKLAGCMGVLTQMRQATVFLARTFSLTRRTQKKCHRVVSTPPTFSDVKTKSGTTVRIDANWYCFQKKWHLTSFRPAIFRHPCNGKGPFEDVLVVLKKGDFHYYSLARRTFTSQAPHLRTMAKT